MTDGSITISLSQFNQMCKEIEELRAYKRNADCILNDIRTEIEEQMHTEISKHYDEESLMYHSFGLSDGLKDAIDIIDKYKGVIQE